MTYRRMRTRIAVVAIAAFMALSTVPAAAAPPDHAGKPGGGGGGDSTAMAVPERMASLGDSITRGFNACGFFFDCTVRSWSTGAASDGVTTHFERLRSLDSTMTTAYNNAQTGATVADLPGQAAAAVSQGAGYVTILIGANDVCTSSESTMTSVSSFESDVRTALAALMATDRSVLVASIPDVHRLWEVGRTSFSALSAWSTFGICQSLLENPLSTSQSDVDRRARVRDRVIAFNGILATVCNEYAGCVYDQGTVFGYPFSLSQLSTWDYFHPNESGQAVLAEETWSVGFDWAKASKGKGGGRNK